VRRSGTLFMMGFNHRFYGPIIELRKLIDAGTLGRPLFLRNIFSGWMSLRRDHRSRPELSGGGCLIDHCSHSVDLFRHLVGEPTHVQAWAANLAQKVPIEDFGMIQLSAGGKAFGEITASYSLRTAENCVEWHGTKGSALVNYWEEGRPDLAYRLEWGPYTPVDCSVHGSDRYTVAIRHFVDCVRTGRQPDVRAEDGVRTSRIVRCIYEAARNGRRVAVR
jgi:predicted dehydrogenase